MNALREIVSSKNGRISMRLPKQYTQQRFEVIVIPIEEKVFQDALSKTMDKIGFEAENRGLTPDILEQLLASQAMPINDTALYRF
jgi:hypothetical protein